MGNPISPPPQAAAASIGSCPPSFSKASGIQPKHATLLNLFLAVGIIITVVVIASLIAARSAITNQPDILDSINIVNSGTALLYRQGDEKPADTCELAVCNGMQCLTVAFSNYTDHWSQTGCSSFKQACIRNEQRVGCFWVESQQRCECEAGGQP